ncbi:hypothetical protein LCGC14_1956480 [marine sediment metagenome]|uniref:SIS domain-containing protein n=1 Tax=marine sediment metagenome TaxID=412755 RepID=A0A0F9FFX8_9ZZZZ
MAETLCTSAQIIILAGANANATIVADTTSTAEFINRAEGLIIAETTFDWIANYTALSASVKLIVNVTCASLAAMSIIQYDMSGYTSRLEAQTMLDVLWNQYREGIKILKDKDSQTFIGKVA